MNNENNLIIDKETREKLSEHTEVLEKVKKIPFLINDLLLTTEQVANYYEVDKSTIDSLLSRNKKELELNELKILKGEELKKFKSDLQSESLLRKFKYVSKLALYKRKTLLNVGMLLTDSVVAEKVRNYLLNIENNSSLIERNNAVDNQIYIEEINSKNISEIKTEEECNLIRIKSSLEKCKMYNIPKEDSIILIQEAIINKIPIDEAILKEIKNRKKFLLERKRKILKIKIDYVAKNYFDCNYPEVYHNIAKKIKYLIGVDIEHLRKKNVKNKLSYFDYFEEYNAYDLVAKILTDIMDNAEQNIV